MDSLERNLRQASVVGKVVLNRLEHWISRAEDLQATERPTEDGGVEVIVKMRMRSDCRFETKTVDGESRIERAPWEILF